MLQARAFRFLLLTSKIDLLAHYSVKVFLTVIGNLRLIGYHLFLPQNISIRQKYFIEKNSFNGCQLLVSSIVFTYLRREDLK